MVASNASVGSLIKQWRQHRRLSQLELAGETDISARHLSFLETGRSKPSRAMLLRLAEQLEIPLRERNGLLVSAGFAPVFPERELQNPALQAAHQAIEVLLEAHLPYPALAIDRHWNLVAANQAVKVFLSELKPEFLAPPINVLRLSFHPEALGARIQNPGDWREHIFGRLRRQIAATSDPVLVALLAELKGYTPEGLETPQPFGGIVIPLEIQSPVGLLSFITTTTVFGTPMEVTLEEIALETFFPANPETQKRLQQLQADGTAILE